MSNKRPSKTIPAPVVKIRKSPGAHPAPGTVRAFAEADAPTFHRPLSKYKPTR